MISELASVLRGSLLAGQADSAAGKRAASSAFDFDYVESVLQAAKLARYKSNLT